MAPERRREDHHLKTITAAFSEVARDVRGLDATVAEHTEERRKGRIWTSVLIVVMILFTLIELISLYESRIGRQRVMDCSTQSGECYQENQERSRERLTQAVTDIVCADARDTRNILRPILEESLPGAEVPPLPEECR